MASEPPESRMSEAAGVLLAASRDGVARHSGQDLIVAEAEFLAVGLPDQHVLHVLMIPGAEVGPAFLAAIEFVPFQGLDYSRRVGGAGPLHGFENLRHGRVAEVTA